MRNTGRWALLVPFLSLLFECGHGKSGLNLAWLLLARQGAIGASVDLDQPLAPGDPGSADVRLEVRSDQSRHAISPLIYGTNQGTNASVNRFGLIRLGGNRLTAYNWETNASNAGSDYYYQNDGYLSASDTPGAAALDCMSSAQAIGAAALLTVPILDYVAADKNGDGDVRDSGIDYLTTRFKQNRPTKGATLSLNPDTDDGFVYQDEFVHRVRNAAGNGQILFSLDNEPDLWYDTHEEIHPVPVTFEELLTRSIDFADAVKTVWPQAPITGFVSYGWNGFVTLQDATDGNDRDFIDFFLDEVRVASTVRGFRLVDYLDLHWYPEAWAAVDLDGDGAEDEARITGTDTSDASVIARVQAPRSLWDPSYTEQSWITDYLGEPIGLIPRMQAKIEAHYPGTKLAFTEWNYGAGDHISGAIASADVLGIFGRYRLDMAAHWKLLESEYFADAAFAAYRNYDGAGHAFGDTSLEATSNNTAIASVYASVDASTPDRTVLVVINKETVPRTAGITIAHPVRYERLKVFVLTSAGPSLVAGTDVAAVSTNAFRYSMPPLSVSVLVPER